MRLLKLLLLSALCFLNACSTIAPKDAQVWSGRFSVTIRNADASDRHSGSFQLTVLPNITVLNISGPLGAQIARVEEKDGLCQLIRPNEAPLISRNSSELMMQVLGVPLSVRNLISWLSGKPTHKEDSYPWKINAEGQTNETPRRIFANGLVPSTNSEIHLVILPKREQ